MQKIPIPSASSVAAAKDLFLRPRCDIFRPEHARCRDGEECGQQPVTAPMSRWFCMLQKRAERMYEEKLYPHEIIVWTSEAKAAGGANNAVCWSDNRSRTGLHGEPLSTNE